MEKDTPRTDSVDETSYDDIIQDGVEELKNEDFENQTSASKSKKKSQFFESNSFYVMLAICSLSICMWVATTFIDSSSGAISQENADQMLKQAVVSSASPEAKEADPVGSFFLETLSQPGVVPSDAAESLEKMHRELEAKAKAGKR